MLPEDAFDKFTEHLMKQDACKKDYLTFAIKLWVLANVAEKLVVSKTLINSLFKCKNTMYDYSYWVLDKKIGPLTRKSSLT